MQPQSPPSRSAERNEFTDAVARMFEHRQRRAPDFAPSHRDDVPVRDEVDEEPRASWLSDLVRISALRRALSIVSLAVIGSAIVWFLYVEPPQNVTTESLVETRPEAIQAAIPVEPPAPARQEVAGAKPAPAPAPAVTTQIVPASPPAIAAAQPSRPLTKDEIKELQGKLGAAGFAAGPIDGVVGPQTQAALRRYAQSRSLANPEATQETLLRLRSESQASQ